jgi:hypothetical protein
MDCCILYRDGSDRVKAVADELGGIMVFNDRWDAMDYMELRRITHDDLPHQIVVLDEL